MTPVRETDLHHGEGTHIPTIAPPDESARVTRRRAQLEEMEADARRENAESLLRGIDALTRKLDLLGPLPLDVVDRYERILHASHVRNLERIATVSDAALASLHEGEA